MTLSSLLLASFLWTTAQSQFNLHDTERAANTDHLQFDCLHFYKSQRPLEHLDDYLVISETIHYCLRPMNDSDSPIVDSLNTRDRNFTFDALHRLNVTTRELLLWSASIDLAERYQHDVDHHNISSASNEIFFNCTRPWFGSRCQYSFDLGKIISLADIIETTFLAKWKYNSPHSVTNLTCYMHLECDRGGASMCLDWREVCDGRVDCLDGGADEAQCFELEINECNGNDYRCHNGLCIPIDFMEGTEKTAECLDQSDLSVIRQCPDKIFLHSTFDCEEYACRPGHEQFPCGDGQCVEDFGKCYNGRDVLLAESMSAQGNLSDECWIAMACLTKIIDQINGTSCEQFFLPSYAILHLQSCESLIQFPTIPVLFGHVRFFYRPKDARDVNIELALTPDYVCYDERLCDFATPTYRNGSNTCRHGHEMGFGLTVKVTNWISIIRVIEPYFRRCLIRHRNDNDSQHPSLYCCKNSLKCISKHRIIDGISDCSMDNDEQEFELSCSINNPHRFKCSNENKCRSPLFPRYICPISRIRNLDEIIFQQICDRVVDVLPVTIDGRNHTDESECEHWQCSNIYTRCDTFWDCPNGEDEENCTRSICFTGSFACVSPSNYSLACLPADRIGNGIIDCLGAADELQYCRRRDLTYVGHFPGYLCLNNTRCVSSPYSLCDSKRDCPLGDDESLCEDRADFCKEEKQPYRTNVEDTFCRIGSVKRVYFSLENSPIYPPPVNRMIEHIVAWPVKQDIAMDDIESEPDDPAWAWRCNQGLYARLWLGTNNYSYRCFCPPNYYGDMCQYQNQRVSLSLKLRAVDRNNVYAIVVILIDDDDDRQEINSYDQSVFVPGHRCRETLNFYLLYSTRPKNSSTNYSIRVDAFDKTSLSYLASWYLRIPFLFLPVNRLVAILTLPAYRAAIPKNCTLICENGECMKYINEEKFFCRCHTGWSGAQCQTQVHCSDCSSDSVCVASIHKRSICICPLNKFGSRCLLTYSCPANFCQNKGWCLVIDERMIQSSYICICSKQFFGRRCQKSKSKLEISFGSIEASPYLLAYMFSVNNLGVFSAWVMLQKRMMFQRTVKLYSPDPFQLVFVKVDKNYYLAVLQLVQQTDISTSISPTQRCARINELFDSRLLALPRIRRVKYYYTLCQIHLNLMCFFDELYLCLCTLERHANCLKVDHNPPKCRNNVHCQNGGECLQDHHICPWDTLCVCTDCFFGDRCQFYAKGIGLTLDDILRYEIRPNVSLNDQPLSVKVSAALTISMLVLGLANSVLSIFTFQRQDSRKVGCGMYLLASAITSLFTLIMFTLKFWFLVLTQIDQSINRSVLRGGFVIIEPVLKLFLYMDNWLNVCVAIERATTVFKGVHFDKAKSIRIARFTIMFLPVFIVGTIIHDPLHRDLFDDHEEKRLWCVTYYSDSIQNYSTIILFFHFLGPFFGNLFSALFIIFTAARRRAVIRAGQSYKQHLCEQLTDHKQLLISPIVLVVLTFPRLIISLLSSCTKASRNPWLYLSDYMISFIPSVVVFIVFVLPSDLYKKQFRESLRSWQRLIN